MRPAVLLLLLLLGGYQSGCSYAFVTPPPPVPRRGEEVPPPDLYCTDDFALPVADTFLAQLTAAGSIFAFTTAYVASERCIDGCVNPQLFVGIGLVSLALTALEVASAVHGGRTVRACHRFRFAGAPPRWAPAPHTYSPPPDHDLPTDLGVSPR